VELKKLSNQDLIGRFQKLVQTERKISHLVLQTIAEIDRRKLFLEKAYSSLFDYLTKGFGYSDSAAVRRIDAARLLREVPEISKKIESGALNLTHLTQFQRAVRQVQKKEKRKMEIAEKRAVLKKIESISDRETAKVLAQELDYEAKPLDRQTQHKDGSVTLTLTLSRAQIEILEQARDLTSTATGDLTWAETFTYLAKKEIARRKAEATTDTVVKTTATVTPRLKREVFARHVTCQYKDPTTGRVCGSRRYLQIDHIQPKWAGGTNDPANLQVLCAAHNKFVYAKQAGNTPVET
jgi:hypothetical protein